MKKLILISVMLLTLAFTGCKSQSETYNDNDVSDFKYGATVKFDIVQFKSVIDEKTLKEMSLNGSYFLFLGGISAKSKETTEVYNTYYMYLKNKNGAIYYAKIPADKVRIYEDAESPCLIAWYSSGNTVNVNKEANWDSYDKFNLHIPKGTIIPRISYNFDLSNVKQ